MIITKLCTKCSLELPLDSFRKQSGTKDGYKYECIPCAGKRDKERYKSNPQCLENSKVWQQNNKEKHNDACKRYYNSVTGRLNRGLGRRLNNILGTKRESLMHLIGTSASGLVIHLESTLPSGISIEQYEEKWFVGFIKEPILKDLKTEEEIRDAFHYTNLCVKEKTVISEDFGVTLF